MLNGEGAQVVEDSQAGMTCRAGDAVGLAEVVRKMSLCTSEQRADMGRNALAVSRQECERDMLITRLERRLEALGDEAKQCGLRGERS